MPAFDGTKAKGYTRPHCRKTKKGKGKCAGTPGKTTQLSKTTGKMKVRGYQHHTQR